MGKFILRSRNVFTGLEDFPRPAAIAVEDKKIRAVLPWDYHRDKDYADWSLYDYGEKMIMSSFLDAHTHLFSGAVDGSRYVCSDLGRGRSQAECVKIIKEFADAHPDYKRIRGSGWFITNWGDEPLPDKRLLDEAIPDRPVYLTCADCHSMWLNSRALEEAGIDPDRKMDNGVNVKFENGELSGLLLEPAACEPAQKKYMEFSEEEMLEIHRNFQDVLADHGIAAASEMFADDYTEDTMKKYEILKKLDEEEGLKAQIFSYMKLFGYTEFSRYFRFQKYFDSPHFHIAGVKGFIDGVTETYTGLLLEPYTDKPETCGEGLPLWPEKKMQKEIIAANKAGIQVRLHCIADGSVRMALDLFEKSAEVNGEHRLRNTIEHIENIHPDDLDRFAELDVIPSIQPYHVTLAANGKVNQIGEKRARLQWPFRTLAEHGGQLALGTDYPVVSVDPFTTIYAAVTRRDDEGKLTSTNPWEKIPMADTLKAYTIGAARVYHVEDSMGTLEPGKMADIIVLSGDLFDVDKEEIRGMKVEANYFEGEKIR